MPARSPAFSICGPEVVCSLRADGVGDDVGEGGLAEAGRAGEQDVVEHVAAPAGGLDHEHEAFLDLLLADEFVEIGWPQRDVEFGGRGAGGFLVEVFAHRRRGDGSWGRKSRGDAPRIFSEREKRLYMGWSRPVESPPRHEGSFFSFLDEATSRQEPGRPPPRYLYVICKANPKFKARQGRTKGTGLSKKGVK